MAKTVVALFDDLQDAQNAIRDLVDSGYRREDVSLVANASAEEYSRYFDTEGRYVGSEDTEDVSRQRAAAGELTPAEGAGAGAGIGAAIGGIGGLLMGLGLLAVPGVGPALAAGPLASALVGAGIGAAAGGLMGALVNSGVPEEEAGYYSEGVRRGGSLVTLSVDDAAVDNASDILERYNPIDIEARAAGWRESGWTGYDPDAEPYTSEEIARERERYGYRAGSTLAGDDTATAGTATAERTNMNDRDRKDRDEQQLKRNQDEGTFEVVEEELEVGKRQVEQGGKRIRSYVTETPVEKDVTLREEHVDVDRHPVDRPASDADFDTFKEGTTEVHATSERPVVNKQARVIEEVVISKDVDTHTETVRDTVRRSDVEVEELEAGSRTHYDSSFARTDYDYDQYRPAYRYGHDLASYESYRDRDWNEVEPEARQRWEERNPGTWEEFKDAVRHGWQQVKSH